MIEPPKPIGETARLMSLHSLRVLDTQPEDRFDRITRMVRQIFGVDFCLVSLVDEDRQWFKSNEGLDACETSREVSFCGHTILSDEILFVPDATADERFFDNPLVTNAPGIRFYAGCPIRGPGGHKIGTLCVIHTQARNLADEERKLLKDFTELVEEELSLLSRSTVDELTGITNRHGFMTVAEYVLAVCSRTGAAAELLYFDLDGFKAVNDSLGHAAGDELLIDFAKLLTKCFRSADVVARVGGDEFVVLMTNTSDASAALQRLDELASGSEPGDAAALRWSVGRASYDPERHVSLDSLMADADAQMFENKQERRAAS